ncbi:hypothetical protein C4556_01070 [Candidatus Parcubacteria bacterium]|nr:MAG: hypothetical protein C4556_01070 [Candidatus Parcubacteria bacterium]
MILDRFFGRKERRSVFEGKTPEQIKEEWRGLVPEPDDIRRDRLAREELKKSQIEREKERAEWIVEDLRQPVENILIELLPDIESGAYSTIIGDDASGRVPTIILAHVIKSIYELKGHQPPVVRFLAGSTGLLKDQKSEDVADIAVEKAKSLAEQVKKIQDTVRKHSEPKKVLIVTDIIDTGESIQTLLSALKRNDWDADVATIGTTDEAKLQELSDLWGTRIVRGRWTGAMIYQDKALTGVQKKKGDLFATPHPEADPDRVRHGRDVARQIARELFDKYKTKDLDMHFEHGTGITYSPR